MDARKLRTLFNFFSKSKPAGSSTAMSERLSRRLAKLLRHDAKQRGLSVTREGYVDIDDILKLPDMSGFCLGDVEDVVGRDNKGRFQLRSMGIKKQIKATQGHSMQVEESDMRQITHAGEVRSVLHGTKFSLWSSICSQGLSRRNRLHIHFAEAESNVQSGFPPGCDMAIEIDLQKALEDGIKFYRSENDVILSPGNQNGVISKEYFRSAYILRTRQKLDF